MRRLRTLGLKSCRLSMGLPLLLLALHLPELASALVCSPSFSRPITPTKTASITARPITTDYIDTHTATIPATSPTTLSPHPSRSPPFPPLDLASPHVRLDIRPATIDELSLIVDARVQIFGQQKKCLPLSPSPQFSSPSVSFPTGSTAGAAAAASAAAATATATATAAATAAAAEEWKVQSMQNLLARRGKGAIVLVATARDLRRPEAKPVLVGSVEASTHEFAEVGFSPCLSEGEEQEGCWDEEHYGNCRHSPWTTTITSTTGSSSSSSSSNWASSFQREKGSKLYITGMMVSEAFRRQGVAASLLRAIDAHAYQNKLNYICLYVEGSNESALRLYEKNGYNLVAFSPQAESFASAIGLYKGPFSARQYSFAYKRLNVGVGSAAAVAVGAGEDDRETVSRRGHYRVGGGGVMQQQQEEEDEEEQQQEKSLFSEPTQPFPARSPSLVMPF